MFVMCNRPIWCKHISRVIFVWKKTRVSTDTVSIQSLPICQLDRSRQGKSSVNKIAHWSWVSLADSQSKGRDLFAFSRPLTSGLHYARERDAWSTLFSSLTCGLIRNLQQQSPDCLIIATHLTDHLRIKVLPAPGLEPGPSRRLLGGDRIHSATQSPTIVHLCAKSTNPRGLINYRSKSVP
jgi:hypothetical protein